MAASKTNVDVISQESPSPHCIHGPTLLFERYDEAHKRSRQFYACAAFRDRKACPFFQWKESWDQTGSVNVDGDSREKGSHSKARKRYRQFKALTIENRHVCCSCGSLLLEGELAQHQAQGHDIKCNVLLKTLKRPSFLFKPLSDNKTFAQYLFSKKCVEFSLLTLENLKFTHILCVGAPRIHEEIQTNWKDRMKSLLLDLDDRYEQVYPPSKFTKYNMFNHHFFEGAGHDAVSEFLREGQDGAVLLTDPPFGGMVEALASSFTKLSTMWQESLVNGKPGGGLTDAEMRIPTLWFFPYFLESRIVSEYPGMEMLDYKVAYDNHSMYKSNHKAKGSPVRIFTNIPQSRFKLPEDEGYWYCDKCQRFSSKENLHCGECKSCTSKDGTTYKHCDMCMRCVKPSRQHCFKCQQCQMEGHVCGQEKSSGCHICGEPSHKRRDCPQKYQKSTSQQSLPISVAKRQMTRTQNDHKEKKKIKK